MTRTKGQLLDRLTQNRGLVGLSEFRDIAREALGEAVRRYPDHPVPAGIPPDRTGEWQATTDTAMRSVTPTGTRG